MRLICSSIDNDLELIYECVDFSQWILFDGFIKRNNRFVVGFILEFIDRMASCNTHKQTHTHSHTNIIDPTILLWNVFGMHLFFFLSVFVCMVAIH